MAAGRTHKKNESRIWHVLCFCFLCRHYWEDLWRKERSVRRVRRQSECKNLQRRSEASASPQHCRPGEVSETYGAEVCSKNTWKLNNYLNYQSTTLIYLFLIKSVGYFSSVATLSAFSFFFCLMTNTKSYYSSYLLFCCFSCLLWSQLKAVMCCFHYIYFNKNPESKNWSQ